MGDIKTKIGWYKGKEVESLSREELYELILHLADHSKFFIPKDSCPMCGADLPPNHFLRKR